MFRSVDVGFGSVKGISNGRAVEFYSSVSDFRAIRYTNGLEKLKLIEKMCVQYGGKSYFVGDFAHLQGNPRATLNKERFISQEGLTLMMSALMLLADTQYESVKLVTGLPVDEYASMKSKYKEALIDKHHLQLINPDGTAGDFYSFNIEDVIILPQPLGTIFDRVLNGNGQIIDKELASARVAVLDIGKFTVDLVLMDKFTFIDQYSTSFNDVGMYDAFKDLSLAIKTELGHNIPADKIEPYVRNGQASKEFKEQIEIVNANQAEKIISRVYNTWTDLWSLDHLFISGGGAIVLGEHIKSSLSDHIEQITLCNEPTLSNARGYYKYANMLWGGN